MLCVHHHPWQCCQSVSFSLQTGGFTKAGISLPGPRLVPGQCLAKRLRPQAEQRVHRQKLKSCVHKTTAPECQRKRTLPAGLGWLA